MNYENYILFILNNFTIFIFHSIYLPTVIYCEFTSELLEIVTNKACRWLPNRRHDLLQFETVVSACVLSQYFFVLMLLKSVLSNVFYYCIKFTFREWYVFVRFNQISTYIRLYHLCKFLHNISFPSFIFHLFFLFQDKRWKTVEWIIFICNITCYLL